MPGQDPWPYVDCSGPNPVFNLGAVTAHLDPTNTNVQLSLQGNFSNMFVSQRYYQPDQTNLYSKLQSSEGPACPLIKGGCPRGAVPGLISTNFTIEQSVPFTELMVTLRIIAPNELTIVCVAVLLEQKMPVVNTAVSYLPLALAFYSAGVSLVSIAMRAAVSGSSFLSAVASYGLISTSEVISVHTPGFFDIIAYTQFMLMTGQLSINYPSFYSTFTALFHWSFLEFRNSFAGHGPDNATDVLMYGGAGSVNQIQESPFSVNADLFQKRFLLDSLQEYRTWPAFPSTTQVALPVKRTAANSEPTSISSLLNRKRQNPDPNQTSSNSNTVSPTPSVPPSSVSIGSSSTSTNSTSTRTTSSSKNTAKSTPDVTSTATSTVPKPTPTRDPVIPIISDPFGNSDRNFKQYNVSRFGMEAYAAAIGAYPSDLFLCTLINAVLAGGASLFLSIIALVIVWCCTKESRQKGRTLQHAFGFVTGNFVRVWLLMFTPLSLSAMFQLTISGGVAMTAIAATSLIILTVGASIFFTWRILRVASGDMHLEDFGLLLKYGTLYNTLAEEGTLFFLVNLLVRFLWGLSVAMLSAYGIAQVAVLMVVELGYMMVIGVKWPYSDSGDNKFHLLLSVVKILVTGCSIPYVQELNASSKIRQIFGYIQMGLHLSVFVVIFALVLWNTIQVFLFWQSRHTFSWQDPSKSYNFDDTTETEHGWALAGRPVSHQPGSSLGDLAKTRRYTVEPYLSGNGESSRDSLRPPPDNRVYGNRVSFRQSHIPIGHRLSRFPSDDDHHTQLDLRSEAMRPLSGAAGPMSARSTSPHPVSPGASVDSLEGNAIPLQPTQHSTARFQPPVRESYTRSQRMNHQQATPDMRTRRMSEIFRDGRYLYEPNDPSGLSSTMPPEKTGVWETVKGALGGVFNIKKSSNKRVAGDGSKPKAFEVIRPPRPPAVVEASDDTSQAGDDNLRELNSIGISRFFQEASKNYERNRSLFVANPEALASQSGSVRSSLSMPAPPTLLQRTASDVTSNDVPSARLKTPRNVSTDLASVLTGMDSSFSDIAASESRRVSTLSVQQQGLSRQSVESNIAEALRTETPVKLQGGAILKISKGPEKAVQYWRKESGQYVEAPVEPIPERKPMSSPSLLMLPTTRGAFLDTIPIESAGTTRKPTPSLKSRPGSRPESPTESHHSNNVAASAERMHEILDRMFSDQDDEGSETISDDEESCSTFSGRVSATILALHQKRELEELSDGQSLYRQDILEPVLEYADSDTEEDALVQSTFLGALENGRMTPKRAASSAALGARSAAVGGNRPTLMRTASNPSTAIRPSISGSSNRPLAQTPLHSPSILPYSGSTPSLLLPGLLSRQSSHSSLREQVSQTGLKSRSDSPQIPNTIGTTTAAPTPSTATTTTTTNP
ncbi:hypothetical protein FBU30_006150 [Linnemannia zychae]|nr:hypothetical protein FBU30_006150 [Linnemannia zychae]